MTKLDICRGTCSKLCQPIIFSVLCVCVFVFVCFEKDVMFNGIHLFELHPNCVMFIFGDLAENILLEIYF